MVNKVVGFVASRDKAIISFWENGELDTFMKHIKKHDGNDVYMYFVNSNQIVKLMTVCFMTLGITSPEVAKYHSQAQRLLEDLEKGENNLS